jgi:hypothetical protein
MIGCKNIWLTFLNIFPSYNSNGLKNQNEVNLGPKPVYSSPILLPAGNPGTDKEKGKQYQEADEENQ